MPAPGQTTTDPEFHTTMRHMTSGSVQTYSQLQAFTTDGKFMLLVDTDGYKVINYATQQQVGPKGWWNAPRWIPNTHKLVTTDYGTPYTSVTFRAFDADTVTWSTMFSLPQFVACDANRGFEEFSEDGQWSSLYGIDAAGDRWLCAVNLVTGQLGMNRRIKDVILAPDPTYGYIDPDWVNVSPLGNYVVVGWVTNNGQQGSGLELYDIHSGAFVRRLYSHHNHSDLGVSVDGREFVATTELASIHNNNNPGLVVHFMDDGSSKELREISWTAAPQHYSCQGPHGMIVLCHSWSGNTTGLVAMEGEISVLYLDGSIRRLAHHRSKAGGSNYWGMPKATVSKDGTRIAFSTDWGVSGQRECIVLENLKL